MLRKISHIGILHKKLFVSMMLSASFSFVPKKVVNAKKYDEVFDLAVIGGGSGGLSTAFQATKYGLKTIVIDFVEESPQRTKWGLGGTCVNVGCIPKKIMHQAAKHGENIIDASDYGWQLQNQINERQKHGQLKKYFSWDRLKTTVMNHIRSINFGYISNINKQDKMEYLNAMATFLNKNTIICSKDPQVIRQFIRTKKEPQPDKIVKIQAKNFLIATGTRPNYLECEGSELAITSDDIFFKKSPPGKTLVVGGGYVAVQIAGFLNGLGYDTTMTTRGKYLRVFDQDMVNQIIEDLKLKKVQIIPTSLPKSMKKVNQNEVEVQLQDQVTRQTQKQTYNTVLFATGRNATTDLLNLESIGVKRSASKKILTNKQEVEKTDCENIYAIGDVVEGLPQLTSTAVKMGAALGKRLVHRILKKEFPQNKMSISLDNYPTTVFTPLQYSVCGLSEQKSIEKYGRQNVQVYHIKYLPLEEQVLSKYDDEGNTYKTKVYVKAVVLKGQQEKGKVVGLHFVGPNAGQVMQGFAVSMKMGLTKDILDDSIGIHPTVAENITNMVVTKESGEQFQKTSC